MGCDAVCAGPHNPSTVTRVPNVLASEEGMRYLPSQVSYVLHTARPGTTDHEYNPAGCLQPLQERAPCFAACFETHQLEAAWTNSRPLSFVTS